MHGAMNIKKNEENLTFWSTLKRGNLAYGNDGNILAMNRKKREEGIKLRNEKFYNLYTIKTYFLKFRFKIALPNKARSQK
jgi:hypothetical protein